MLHWCPIRWFNISTLLKSDGCDLGISGWKYTHPGIIIWFFSLLVVDFCTQVRYTGISKPICSSSICPPTKVSQSSKPIESMPLKMCLSPSALMRFTSISVFKGLFWARCKGWLSMVLYLMQLGTRAEKLKDRKLRSRTGGSSCYSSDSYGSGFFLSIGGIPSLTGALSWVLWHIAIY